MVNQDTETTPPKRSLKGRPIKETAEAATLRREKKKKEKLAAAKKAKAEKAAQAEADVATYDEEEMMSKGIYDPEEEEEEDYVGKDDVTDPSDEEGEKEDDEMDAIFKQRSDDPADDVAQDTSGSVDATKKPKSKTTKATVRSASQQISSALRGTSPTKKKSAKKTSLSTMTRWLEGLGFDHVNHPPFHTNEGISTFSDLAEFDDKTLRDVLNQKPYIKIPALVKQRIITARMLVKIFMAIGRPLSRKSLSLDVIKDFQKQYELIREAADKEPGDFPQYKTGVDSLVFENAVKAHLKMASGKFDVPLIYLIRTEKDPGPPPPLAPGKCYSAKFKSLSEELIAYLPIDGSAKNDLDTFASLLNTSTLTSTHAAALKPHIQQDDGRAAWFALRSLIINKASWQAKVKEAEKLLASIWNFHSPFGFPVLVAKFTQACSILKEAAAAGLSCQTLTERQKVDKFLELLQRDVKGTPTQTAPLMSAISTVRANANGEMQNFDLAVARINEMLPHQHKQKRRDTTERALISNVDGSRTSNKNKKQKQKQNEKSNVVYSAVKLQDTRGKNTGVDLRRHYTPEQWNELSDAQKFEVMAWKRAKSNSDRNKERAANAKKTKAYKAKIAALEAKLGNNADDDDSVKEDDGVDLAKIASLLASVAKRGKKSSPKTSKKKAKISDVHALPNDESAIDESSDSDASIEEEEDSESPSDEESDDELFDSDEDDDVIPPAARRGLDQLAISAPTLANKGAKRKRSQKSKSKKHS